MRTSPRNNRQSLYVVLILAVLAVTTASANAQSATYNTTFQAAESPIAEKGAWINGHTAGLDWTNIQTAPGMAFGTQDGSGRHDDSLAVLKAKWPADQTAEATVCAQNKLATQEIELRLRNSISPHKATGYSVKFSVGGVNYVQIVRLNGTPEDSTRLAIAENVSISDGDTIKASISGNTITAFINGQQVIQASDSAFAGGKPGFGFFVADGGSNSNFGLASFKATGGTSITTASTSAAATTSAAPSGNYTTNFPLTENPISEGGIWVNGLATGLKWQNVRTTAGFAFGTESGSINFDDSTAILTGTWGPNQTAQATVKVVQSDSGSGLFEEVELRLRSTITANSNTGYEINCSVIASDPYMQIVRWNGPFGSWTQLDGRGVGCQNGDVLKATISGSTITAYKNGTAIFSATDSTYSTGNPGIGFYLQGGSSTLNPHFGFSNFTVTDGSSPSAPAPPTNLTATPH